MLSITNSLSDAENAFQDECILSFLRDNPGTLLSEIELLTTQGEFSRDAEGNLIYSSSCMVRKIGEENKENKLYKHFRIKFVTYI